MKEEVINGIKYRLNEETLTAEVIELKDDLEHDETKLTAEKLMKMMFNGYKGDMIIPETVEFKGVTYRVTSIGEKAFARSFSLKSVTIPDSVTSIGEKAFNDCKKLESIVIPDSVTSIGEYAFVGCKSLTTKVEIGEKIIDGIKYILYCNRTAKVIQNGGYKGDIIIPEIVDFNERTYRVTSIGDRAFKDCNNLTSITIPDSVMSIGNCAFTDCNNLTSIIIPDNIMSIGDMTFSGCYALTEIVIPDSVKSIGYEAFELCSSLKSIVIPARVTEIKERAFVGCKSLTSVIVAEGNPRYDSRENCNAIIETATNTLIRGCSQTIIPESVTEIGEEAFSSCDSLTSITIPDGVTSIGAEAFRNCESLKSITIPVSMKSIGGMAFDMCESLTSITFQGTIAQWEEIKLGFCWRQDVPARVVYCTDGDVKI